jgi:hypothetical protein
MWPNTFENRLLSWKQLRSQTTQLNLEDALHATNQWWFRAPWRPYFLHWDDQESWPDPWELLDNNFFCELARSLGIVYTLELLDRPDIENVEIVDIGIANLVQVNDGKYILNYDPKHILNIPSKDFQVVRRLSGEKLKNKIG